MKLIIDIPDITYKRTLEIGTLQICTDNDIYRWIAKGTPIPNNATNDDLFKAILDEKGYCAIRDRFKLIGTKWLYAPYKGDE